MKLLQLNCWGGKLGTSLIRLIEAEQPDIVCLQEATDLHERPGSVLMPMSHFLPSNKYPHTFFVPTFSYRYMHELANLGNSIISNQPFVFTNSFFVNGSFTKDIESLDDGETYNVRNVAHTVVQLEGGICNIVTHHGYHSANGKDGSAENERQLKLIAEYIRKLEGPVILTGDFNLHPNSKSLKPINDLLINLAVKYDITSTRTELAKRQEVIDYIFVSEDVKVNDFYVSEMIASDHKALILDFSV